MSQSKLIKKNPKVVIVDDSEFSRAMISENAG
jgi:hypothetical protein